MATLGGDGDGWDLATSVARGRDVFVAIGVRYERAPEIIFQRPREYLWVSEDGQQWDDVPVDLAGATLAAVVSTPNGGFILAGTNNLTSVAWKSADGRHWQEHDLDLGADLIVERIVQGEHGYLLGAYHVPTSARSVWHSTDGVAWEEVLPAERAVIGAVGAGDEGFVAIGTRFADDGGPEPAVFASADGSTWFDAPQTFGLDERACTPPVISAMGGDWAVVSAMPDAPPQVWNSENGLDWESVGSIPNASLAACEPPALTYAEGELLFSPSTTFHSLSSVVWSSSDGQVWELWEPGQDAAVLAAIDTTAGAVAVGATVRGADASLASFWFAP